MNKLYSIRIETPRLILRSFELRDIEPSYQMNLDPEVSRYTGDGGVVSRAETERRIKEHVFGDYKKHGYGRLAVELKGKASFIGFAGLKFLEDLKEVDLGYRFMKEYWGQGIASEAAQASVDFGFATLNLQRIIALVLPANQASVRVLEKIGFQYEKEILEEGEMVKQYFLNRPEERDGR